MIEPSQTSEKELFDKIAFRHDVLKEGFRKLSSELRSEGIDINKDKAHRIYRKHSESLEVREVMDNELQLLTEDEKDQERQVDLAKAKHEKRVRISSLLLQKAELDPDYRAKLFQNNKMLFDFSRNVLPISRPDLWLEFIACCATMKMRPPKVLREVVGDQATYEETRRTLMNESRTYFLDEYIILRLDEWLLDHRPNEQEEDIDSSEECGGLPEDIGVNIIEN